MSDIIMEHNKYEKRGVSSTKDDVHKAIKNLDKGLYPNAFCKILPDILTKDEQYCVLMHADTAGTKTSLAYIYWRETGDLSVWKGIVQDAMVMNIDDMACVGCFDDIIISATLGRNKKLVDGSVVSTIIQYAHEFVEKMKSYGVTLHLAGGETADVGDIVRTADVGYTAFGRMRRDKVLSLDIQEGDYVVGFASYGQAVYEDQYNSGMGCNGLTSARHDMFAPIYRNKYPESFDPSMPEDLSYIGKRTLTEKLDIPELNEIDFGKLVLSPTRTYLPLLKRIFDHFKITDLHGIVHNTGGGQYKVNHFIDKDIHIIKDNILEVPPLFQYIHEDTGVDYGQMFKVFNMGTRLEVYTHSMKAADQMILMAQELGIDAQIIGNVASSTSHKGTTVSYKGNDYFVPA